MLVNIFKIIVGLFVFLVLSDVITKRKKYNKSTKMFINLTCKIVGAVIILYSAIDIFHHIF